MTKVTQRRQIQFLNVVLNKDINTKMKFKIMFETFEDAVILQEESTVDTKACIKEGLGGDKVNGPK